MNGFLELLAQLSTALTEGRLTPAEAAAQVVRFLPARMACERASLWVFEADGEQRTMRQAAGSDAVTGVPLTGAELDAYLAALSARGIYVGGGGGENTLHASMGVNGTPWGVLCCTRLGTERPWLPAEITLLKRFAHAIALRRARRRFSEGAGLSLMQRFLQPALPTD